MRFICDFTPVRLLFWINMCKHYNTLHANRRSELFNWKNQNVGECSCDCGQRGRPDVTLSCCCTERDSPNKTSVFLLKAGSFTTSSYVTRSSWSNTGGERERGRKYSECTWSVHAQTALRGALLRLGSTLEICKLLYMVKTKGVKVNSEKKAAWNFT